MNLSNYFSRYFELIPADTDDLIEEVLRLRYQVYCVENTFLSKNNCSNLKECDLYDAHSIHKLIRHKSSGLFVASVRFILADPTDIQKKFPIEEFYSHSFYGDVLPWETSPRESLSEVSRFLISRERERQVLKFSFRQTRGVRTRSIYKRKDGLVCYLLLFGLITAVLRTATEEKLPYWFVCMEPKLLRLLRMFGISFTQLGPLAEYYGKRIPCLGSTESILSGIRKYRPELYDFVTRAKPAVYNKQREVFPKQEISSPLRGSPLR